MITKEVKNDN